MLPDPETCWLCTGEKERRAWQVFSCFYPRELLAKAVLHESSFLGSIQQNEGLFKPKPKIFYVFPVSDLSDESLRTQGDCSLWEAGKQASDKPSHAGKLPDSAGKGFQGSERPAVPEEC